MNSHNSKNSGHKALFYLGMQECFDPRSPTRQPGHILHYSFFTDSRFVTCLSGVAATDPRIFGLRMPELMDDTIHKALRHMSGREWQSFQVLNGTVYHPSEGITISSEDPGSDIQKIPENELRKFFDAVNRFRAAVSG